jgi:hypothetical protein
MTAAGGEFSDDRHPETAASADHERCARSAGEVAGEVEAVFGHG